MRETIFVAVLIGLGVAAIGAASQAEAQPYGPGMMGGGYSGGYGYGHGYMMGPGDGPGYMMGPGYGPGMGYDGDERGYRRGRAYRGQRMCWTQTDPDRNYGFYAPCRR